ncbi:LolA family protein [Fictibacillus sp. KU28468]|uniref:LolA family protein n=1 Tax=Fictibacillus sp. KU28468 TaxID=2991053 RepID=UPI00223D9088|nr:outer membrane lipoprotein carrier protein LolA [Fictibacillus sp. KU28468]UZJ78795.1 outer membrane lipoprotein carrier protein LolA [Fictibacillus sp. KU28468]
MKKTLSITLMAFLFIFGLAGCGAKSQEDVVTSLDKKMEEMTGYKADAVMTLNTGEKPIQYQLEVWHKKPNFYRVNLKNAKKDQSQMILRNKEGVFVLTPALNKSFRFQSDWPENNSQVYLFESLAADILNDTDRGFKAMENSYVFHTKTNYQNKNLYQQEITLNKDLAPKTVRVMDKDAKELVKLQFSNVKFDAKFDKGAFDMETNMTGAQLELPAMSQKSDQKAMEVLYPKYSGPGNIELTNEKEVSVHDGKQVVLSFSDENNKKTFTLIERKNEAVQTTAGKPERLTMPGGEPVDLGYTVGAMNDKSISWTYKGVDFFLASNSLDQEELMAIARSVSAQGSK